MKKTLLFSRLIAIGLMMLFSSGWAVGQVFITELADPGNGAHVRYIELYNAGGSSVDFTEGSGWMINKYTNGSATVSQTLALTGTIPAGGFYIIATGTDDGDFAVYGVSADQYDGATDNVAGSNGDDTIEIVDGTGATVDFYGTQPITDLTGTVWEFEDGRAERAIGATTGKNPPADADWNTWSDGPGGDIIAVKNAPDDFDPRAWIGAPTSDPTMTVSTSALDGFTYEVANGPSTEQTFDIEGANLTDNISITAPTNYEISTGTGGSFSATSPITLTQSGGDVSSTTIYVRLKAGLAAGYYNAEDIIASSTGVTNETVSCSGSVYGSIDWANLQWPPTGTVSSGGDLDVYAQVYEAGLTDPAGQAAGITAWIGYSTSNSDPSTWTSWLPASYSGDVGNNDEYITNLGAAIAAPGVYYYASRFQLGSGSYYYGGFVGGAWDGTTNVSGVLTVTGTTAVIINEVDADTEGTDVLEFIELYDGGTGNTGLDGLVLVLYNGSDDQSYTPVFDLDGYSTDVNGYFVIGNAAVASVDLVANSNFLQNGADAAALYYGSDSDFPNDTPITTTDLIDAMVYGTDDSDDAGLLPLLNASQPQVDEGVYPDRETASNQRFPNGTGGARNTDTYCQATPTPGAINNGDNVWTGVNSIDYNDALNWTGGTPTSGHNVTIPVVVTNYPTVIASTTGYCDDLEIAAGASLTNSGGVLAVGGDLVIQSDVSASGSLIGQVVDASFGVKTITYNRYVTGGQWHLMGAPADGQDIGDLIDAVANDISFMKDYNTGTDTWNADFTSATAGTMTSGEGYAIKRSTDGIISVSGTVPSNPNVTLDKTGNGWNLLGNPYASAVYATTPVGPIDYLLNASNVGSMATGFEALYVWEEDLGDPTNTNNYKLVNNAGSGDLYKLSPQVTHLQAGQGFFVKASATATTFDFTASMQDHQSTLSLYKEEAAQWPTVSLQAEISNAKASTTITYNSMMTKGLDKTYDAGLLNSYPEFALYSRLVEDYEGIDFMLQALPEDYDNLVVPIGLDAKGGEIITFSAQSLNIPVDYAVVLEDRAMNVFTDLSDEGEYAVQLDNSSEGTGRFFVRTSMKSALGVGDLDTENAFQVFTRVNDHQLVIRGEATVHTQARIYSITGKQIATVNLAKATEQSVQFNEEAGVYIVQISNEQGTYTQKFSWVK